MFGYSRQTSLDWSSLVQRRKLFTGNADNESGPNMILNIQTLFTFLPRRGRPDQALRLARSRLRSSVDAHIRCLHIDLNPF